MNGDLIIERGRLGAGTWETVTRAAARGLDGAIGRYCGYREDAGQPVRRREAATPRVVLIIGFGNPLRIAPTLDADDGQVVTSFVAGLGDVPVFTEHPGTLHGVEVLIPPTVAYSLFDLPMAELSNRVVALEDVWGRSAIELSERLADAPTWGARFDMLDRALGRALSDGARPDPRVVGGWRELERLAGDAVIGDIQRTLGWSRRRLAERFREQVGLTPKAAARVLRFDRAATLLVQPGPRSLASIALACGYYDQAHFNREFRRMAGCTPSQYLSAQFSDAPGVGP